MYDPTLNRNVLLEGDEAGAYTATIEGMGKTLRNAAIGGVIEAARDMLIAEFGPTGPRLVTFKVRELTHVSAREVLELLVFAPTSDRLDFSYCNLIDIDLSPEALDKAGFPRALWPEGGVPLAGTTLTLAHLTGANLRKARLWDADLRRAGLRNTQLQEADLSGAQMQHARLYGTHLENANLQGANLEGAVISHTLLHRADLRGCSLQGALLSENQLGSAKLGGADLRSARVLNTAMEGVDIREADLRQVDLRGTGGLKYVRWHNARLEKTWLYPHQVHPIQDDLDAVRGADESGYLEAMEAYLVLKANFASLGTYGAAASCYVKEQQMRKALFFPTTAGKRWLVGSLGQPPSHAWTVSAASFRYRSLSAWLHLRLFLGLIPQELRGQISRWRWARNWLFELLTGYGERPQMPVFWGLVTILLFALVFAGAGNIATGDPAANAGPTHSFITALTHSVAAFATVGFNTLEPVGWEARLLTAVESMLGIGFFALLIYTLGNRMSRS